MSSSTKTILITGGSGLIGKLLSKMLIDQGHSVRHLSRKENLKASIPKFGWNLKKKTINTDSLKGVNVIIHLAGAPIVDSKWTESYKKEIINSRTAGVELIANALKNMDHEVEHFISSSGIGYYGAHTSDAIYEENAKPYPDFVSYVCQEWEKAAELIKELGIRCSFLRTGIVLSKAGGALPKLARPIKLFVGSALGNGKQWMPWIHIDDLCKMYIYIMDHQLPGIYNAITNDHKSNRAFVKLLSIELNRPLFAPNVPAFLLKTILGPRAVLVLNGSRVSADKIINTGYTFTYPLLHQALRKEYA